MAPGRSWEAITSVASSLAAAAVAAMVPGTIAAETKNPERPKMPSALRPSFVETNDGASLFNDWGTGKPVLFTHAWGLNADIWEYQALELADHGLRCVAYDRRGHGRSTDPGRCYDFDRLADDLGTVIDQLDLKDVTLVAYSMGTIEAVRYLRRHGRARVKRLVMVSTLAPQPDTRLFDSFIAGLKKDRPAFFASGVSSFTGGHPAVSPAMTEWVSSQFMRASPKGIIECMRAISRGDFRADMRAVTVPTLMSTATGTR